MKASDEDSAPAPPAQRVEPQSTAARCFWRCCSCATVAAYVALLFSYAWPWDLRATGLWSSRIMLAAFLICTFRFHIGIAMLAPAAIAIVRRRWRLGVAAGALAVFLLLPTLMAFVPKSAPRPGGATFTITSANLLYTNRAPDELVAELRAADADVLVLQEYTPRWHEAIHAALGERYSYQRHVLRTDAFGVAIYSRLPVEELRTDVSLGTIGSPQIRAVLRHDGRRFVLYDIHLMPPRGSRAFTEQRLGLADLIVHLREESGPLIVCGDFNFTADSEFAARMHALGLRDAHDLAGFGRGATWPVRRWWRYVPGLRLDHIYVSDAFAVTESRTGVGRGSDHRPVSATLGWASPAR